MAVMICIVDPTLRRYDTDFMTLPVPLSLLDFKMTCDQKEVVGGL